MTWTGEGRGLGSGAGGRGDGQDRWWGARPGRPPPSSLTVPVFPPCASERESGFPGLRALPDTGCVAGPVPGPLGTCSRVGHAGPSPRAAGRTGPGVHRRHSRGTAPRPTPPPAAGLAGPAGPGPWRACGGRGPGVPLAASGGTSRHTCPHPGARGSVRQACGHQHPVLSVSVTLTLPSSQTLLWPLP